MPPAEREALLAEIAARLVATVDPATGEPAVDARLPARGDLPRRRPARRSAPTSSSATPRARAARTTRRSARSSREVFDRQRRAVERRPLHGPPARAGHPAHQPAARAAGAEPAGPGAAILAEFGVEGFPARAPADWRRRDRCSDTKSVKLDKELLAKVKRYAEIAGYSSVEEFITHALEKELAKLEDADSEEEIKKRLRGLGYIS